MFKDKLKKIIDSKEETEGNNKKKIENLVFFVVILIITIFICRLFFENSNLKKMFLNKNPLKK